MIRIPCHLDVGKHNRNEWSLCFEAFEFDQGREINNVIPFMTYPAK